MSSDDLFANYAEALGALSTVEARQREALRKAVEASAATESRAKTQIADQQRMYDRAAKDAIEAENLLVELRLMLGLPRRGDAEPPPQAGVAPQLVEIRSRIREIAEWTTESTATAESLLRTRERLSKASGPAPAAPAPQPTAPARNPTISTGTVIAVLAAIATLAVIVLAIAQ